MKYAWIDSQRHEYPLQALCGLLGVSTSGYADWEAGGGPTQWLSDGQLLMLIRSIHAESKQAYGSPRVTAELKGRGIPVSRERVRRLMQAHGIRARHKRRYKVTTDSKHTLPVAPNLLNRQFETAAPEQAWTADISAPCRRGWRNPDRSGWFPTGSWNAALLGRDTGQKGAAKFCRVLTAGCHKQSSLNCT